MYWDKQWHTWSQLPRPRPPLRLRPVLPIVLYTGARPWGSNRTLVDLLDEPAAFHAFAPAWQPLFWNLAEQTPQELLATGEEWLQALAVIRVQDEEAAVFAEVYRAAVRRLAALHASNPVRWYDLMRILLTYACWRRPAEERATLLAEAQAVNEDLVRKKEIAQMSEKLGATFVDLALARGRLEGNKKASGWDLRARREDLRDLLEDRFGPLAAEVLQRIEGCEDPVRLQAAVRQAWHVNKPEEILL